jgi:hypothetical protein
LPANWRMCFGAGITRLSTTPFGTFDLATNLIGESIYGIYSSTYTQRNMDGKAE